MAVRATIDVQAADANGATGVDLKAAMQTIEATEGDKYNNRGGNVLFIISADADASVNVTIDSVADPYGREGDLGPTAIGNSVIMAFGPFSPRLFNQSATDDGFVHVDYDTYVAGAGFGVEAVALSS